MFTRNVYKQLEAEASKFAGLVLPEIEPLSNHLFLPRDPSSTLPHWRLARCQSTLSRPRPDDDQAPAGKTFNPVEDSDRDGVDDVNDTIDGSVIFDFSNFYLTNKVEYMSPSQAETGIFLTSPRAARNELDEASKVG